LLFPGAAPLSPRANAQGELVKDLHDVRNHLIQPLVLLQNLRRKASYNFHEGDPGMIGMTSIGLMRPNIEGQKNNCTLVSKWPGSTKPEHDG
jgi:hypothetical protein